MRVLLRGGLHCPCIGLIIVCLMSMCYSWSLLPSVVLLDIKRAQNSSAANSNSNRKIIYHIGTCSITADAIVCQLTIEQCSYCTSRLNTHQKQSRNCQIRTLNFEFKSSFANRSSRPCKARPSCSARAPARPYLSTCTAHANRESLQMESSLRLLGQETEPICSSMILNAVDDEVRHAQLGSRAACSQPIAGKVQRYADAAQLWPAARYSPS